MADALDRLRARLRRPSAEPSASSVSVVVKSYNHAKYIGQAIESLLLQDFENFEIVIADDASTDNSVEIIRRYSDPRIKLEISPVNLGLSANMNSALARANGTYIAILNSDDVALPGRLRRQVAYLDAHPEAAAVFTQVVCIGEDGARITDIGPFAKPLSFADFTRPTWVRQFFMRSNCLCAPSAMLRRSAVRSTGTYDPRFTNLQDLHYWTRLSATGELHVLPDRLTAFRIRAGNANLSAPRPDSQLRHHFEYFQILRRMLELPSETLHAAFDVEFSALGINPAARLPIALAELALELGQPAHLMFALQTIFDNAATPGDFERLKELTGTLNVFGLPLPQLTLRDS